MARTGRGATGPTRLPVGRDVAAQGQPGGNVRRYMCQGAIEPHRGRAALRRRALRRGGPEARAGRPGFAPRVPPVPGHHHREVGQSSPGAGIFASLETPDLREGAHRGPSSRRGSCSTGRTSPRGRSKLTLGGHLEPRSVSVWALRAALMRVGEVSTGPESGVRRPLASLYQKPIDNTCTKVLVSCCRPHWPSFRRSGAAREVAEVSWPARLDMGGTPGR